jgi:hypothetical protein
MHNTQRLKVPFALSKIDSEGVLFFLGILLSIGCLDSAGILKQLATFLDNNISSQEVGATAPHVSPRTGRNARRDLIPAHSREPATQKTRQ